VLTATCVHTAKTAQLAAIVNTALTVMDAQIALGVWGCIRRNTVYLTSSLPKKSMKDG